MCSGIKKRHGNHPVIVIIDECFVHEKDKTKGDWNGLCLPADDNFHLILSFAPIQRDGYDSYIDAILNEELFLVKSLYRRYRNSHEVQQLIKHINNDYSKQCIKIEEKLTPSVSGPIPVWIDIGAEFQLLPRAIETLKSLHCQQSSDQSKGYLLYSGEPTLSDKFFTDLFSSWGDSETCIEWESFTGCETESVIFITPGISGGFSAELESISRAKVNLAIISIHNKDFDPAYDELVELLGYEWTLLMKNIIL